MKSNPPQPILTMVAAIATCITPALVTAQENTSTWSGEAELGFVATSGNTDTKSIKARAKIVNDRTQWRHTGLFDGLKSEDEGSTTAERFLVSGKSDYKLSEFRYLFGTVIYEDDKFSGYDYRLSGALGYGTRVLNKSNLFIDLEGGPGARQSKLESGGKENEFILRLGGKLEWKITETTVFDQILLSEIGEDATISRSVTSLTAQVVGSLAMRASLTVRHVSDVPDDIDNTDVQTAVTLVYGI